MDQMHQPSVCVIVPAYNEEVRIAEVLHGVRATGHDMVVIDDGSSDGTGEVSRTCGAHVVRHDTNLGKGASLITGFNYARDKGYELIITIDADGQHDPAAIPKFIETYQRTRIPVLIGNRMWDKLKMPVIRRWTNQAMSRLLSRFMNSYLPDTQCGLRLFRADILTYVPVKSPRFAMESEILLNMALRGFRMDSVRISVVYRGQTSRINPVVDAYRFFTMLRLHLKAIRARNK